MPNLRVGYLNYADLVTLTANPAAGALTPVTFLQNDNRGDFFKATSNASQDILGTIAAGFTAGQLTLWRHNLAFGDTIRLQLYSDTAWTTGIYDSTALAAYTSGLFDSWGWGFTNRYFTPVANVKSFKITISAAAAVQVARLYLGPYTEAPYNPRYGFVLGVESSSKQSRSEGGSLRSDTRALWRSAAFDLYTQTEADRAAWYEISRYCDISKSLVASLFPGNGGAAERDHTLYGKFEKAPATKLTGVNLYDQSVRLLEL
jgi:hypothetical protein